MTIHLIRRDLQFSFLSVLPDLIKTSFFSMNFIFFNCSCIFNLSSAGPFIFSICDITESTKIQKLKKYNIKKIKQSFVYPAFLQVIQLYLYSTFDELLMIKKLTTISMSCWFIYLMMI